MANKNKNKKKSSERVQNLFSSLNPALKNLAGGDEDIFKGFKAGSTLASSFFAPGGLGRVSEEADPYMIGNIGQFQDAFNRAGTRTTEATARLQGLQDLFTRAQQLTPEEQDIIARRRANLSGLSQEEEQYLKDSGQIGLNRSLQTSLRAIRSRFPGATGASSTIAARPTVATFADSTRQLLRDVGQEKISRSREALDAYDTSVGGINNSLFSRSAATGRSAADAGLAQDQFEAGNKLALGDKLTTLQQQLRDDILKRQGFNLQQGASERAGQLGLIFGSGQFSAAQTGRRTSEDLAREAIAKGIGQVPAFDFSSFPPPTNTDTYGTEA